MPRAISEVCSLEMHIFFCKQYDDTRTTDTRADDDDDDTVLDYQPRDLAAPGGISAFANDTPLVQTDPSSSPYITFPIPAGAHEYDYPVISIDPLQYDPSDLLRTPPPDAEFEITMANMDGWNSPLETRAPRQKRVVTGADLMQGIMTSIPEDVSVRQMGTSKTPSPREKHKPRLTIAVPTPGNTSRRAQSYGVGCSEGYSSYPHLQPKRVEEIKLAARTDAGDDVLDWGEDDDDLECGGAAVGDAVDGCEPGAHQGNGEGIRRARSTPPTPRSSQSFLDVPVSSHSNIMICERDT